MIRQRILMALVIVIGGAMSVVAQNAGDLVDLTRQKLALLSDKIKLNDAELGKASGSSELTIKGTITAFGQSKLPVTLAGSTTSLRVTIESPAGLDPLDIRLAGVALGDWLPTWLRSKVKLQRLDLAFERAKESTSATAKLSLTAGSAVDFQGLSLKAPSLSLTLTKQADQTTVGAELRAAARFGSADLSLVGKVDSAKQWSVTAELGNLSLSNLIQTTAALGGQKVAALPKELQALAVQQARLSLDSSNQLGFAGQLAWGSLRGAFKKGGLFYLALVLKPGLKFAAITPFLTPIDKLGLTGGFLVYTTDELHLSQIGADPELGEATIAEGLTILGGFQLPKGLPGIDTGTTRVTLLANWQPAAASLDLLGAVQFKGLNFGGGFSLLGSYFRITWPQMSLGIGARLKARIDNSDIIFNGLGQIAAPGTFELIAYMEQGSVWRQPFGIKGVEISGLGIDLGADVVSPVPRPKLGLKGSAKIGRFIGSAAGIMDTADPTGSLIAIKFNQVTLSQIAEALLGKAAQDSLSKAPAPLRTLGLKDVELSAAAKPITFGDQNYPAGLLVAGTTKIADFTGKMRLEVDYDNGLSGSVSLSPITITDGGKTVFSLSGTKPTDPATASIDLTKSGLSSKSKAFLAVDMNAQLMGLRALAKVALYSNGIVAALSGKVYDKFAADLRVFGPNLSSAKSLIVQASFKSDLLKYFNQKVSAALDAQTKADQTTYKNLRDALAAAEKVLSSDKKLADFKDQEKKVKAAQKKLNKAEDAADDAKDDLDDAPVYRKPDLAVVWATKKGYVTTAREILKGYKATLDQLSKAIDWTKTNAAVKAVDLAEKALEEFEAAEQATKAGAKWIVDNGLGSAFDINSAEFLGALDLAKGGSLVLDAEVVIFGDTKKIRFELNFGSPEAAAEALIKRALMSKTAAKAADAADKSARTAMNAIVKKLEVDD